MPTPIVCLNERLRQFAAAFQSCFSLRGMEVFVGVALARRLCQEQGSLAGEPR